jgi:hypothetical protein
MRRSFIRALSCVATGLVPIAASAHHSYAEYDQQQTIEIHGTLEKVAWQNPHVRFTVLVPGAAGAPVRWDIESSGINNLSRMGAKVDYFRSGSKVKVAGWPSKRGTGRMYVTNLLSEDGHELVLWRFSKLRWAKTGAGYGTGADSKLFASGVASGSASLFRVWASDYDDPDAAPETMARTVGELPLTPSAAKARAAANPANAKGFAGCNPKGMPNMMSQPFPMEIADKGKVIEVRIEEYDAVRTINMSTASDATAKPPRPEGYSTGRWEGKTLVVTTSGVTPREFDATGLRRTPAARYVERFTPSEDGSRLHYSVTITDPDVFTRPVEMKRSWVFRPGEKVMPFNCKPGDETFR